MKEQGKDGHKMALLRCQYPYGKRQIWLPTDLNKIAARLDSVGINTDIVDLNLESIPRNLSEYDFIGIGVIGAPYVPTSRILAHEVLERTGKNPIIGGPGIEYLTPEEFKILYGDAIQIRNDSDFEIVISRGLPSIYETSIATRLKNMNRERLEKYLRNEFSFFVSQGCKYSCDFCAAVRSRPGEKVIERFSYTVEKDLEAICVSADGFGIKELTMYLTSLDLFQNPSQVIQVLKVFSNAANKYGINFKLRGLSRIDSFLDALKQEPEFYEVIPNSGLKVVGFGVDGTTEEVWKSQHKGNRSLSDADDAFETCRSLGITPEALMVMGFHDTNGNPVDNRDSLRRNADYSISRAETYSVTARPHIAKDMVPGNNGWKNPTWREQRARLLKTPDLFRNLDFVVLGSEITHPNGEFREQVNEAYLDIVKTLAPKGKCATSPLMPYTGDTRQDKIVDNFNMLVPFDK